MHLADYIGETTSYDKKLMLERKDPTSWLKSVSAFANTQGGRLLFGVANDGSLVGLADAQGDSEFISETIKMQMDPVPEIDLSLPNLHYAASHGAVASFAGAKKRSAKSSAKRGVESSAKSGAKSSAIRRGKAAGKNENIIFRAIRDNSHVSIAELQRKTRLSNGGVRKIISVLKSKGKIVRVGGTHGGYWEILK